MINASVNLQDLRRKIYIKAKAETHWKFWGLYKECRTMKLCTC
jgi:RNA-directed DNA polymerase